MIPEGLVLLTSLAFGVAVIQLGRRKVLVQELAAVEVLARVDVLCLDKTGTLTSGEIGFDLVTSTRPGSPPCGDAELALSAFGADVAGNPTAGILSNRTSTPTRHRARAAAVQLGRANSAASSSTATAPRTWVLGAPERLLAGYPDALDRAHGIAATGARALALAAARAPPPTTPRGPPRARASGRRDRGLPRDGATGCAADARLLRRAGACGSWCMSGDNPVTVGAIAGELGLPGEAGDASTLDSDEELAEALGRPTSSAGSAPEQKRAGRASCRQRATPSR